MKGLLIGVFFAIKGLFQFIGAAAVVPFAIPKIWNHINSVPNCGFGYYLFTIVVGLIGLVVFFMVVRNYKYRQRDERPFDTRFAEQYYERYIGTFNYVIHQLVCIVPVMRTSIKKNYYTLSVAIYYQLSEQLAIDLCNHWS